MHKILTQILSTANGTRWCVGAHICGLEDYLSKWTYCATGNELRPLFSTFPAWMVWVPSAQAAEKITAGLTVHAHVIIAFNRRVITFV